MGRNLDIGDGCTIPVDELEVRADPSGGPGGQHANRSNTRVTVSFDVTTSPSLSDPQRRRLLAKLGPTVVVSVDETRSQARNRELAYERLRARLAAALVRPKSRRPTKPSRAAKERRLEEKRRQSHRKSERRSGFDD